MEKISYQKIYPLFNNSTVATWINFSVKFGGFSILLPLVLSKFNVLEMQLWLIFQFIIGLVTIFDFGLTQTLSRVFNYLYSGANSLSIGKNNKIKSNGTGPINWVLVHKTYLISKIIYCVISITLFICLLISYKFIIPDSSTYKNYNYIFVAWIIFSIIVSIKLFGNLYVSILLGFDKIVEVNYWDALVGIIGLFSTIVCVLLTTDVLIIILIYVIWYVVISAKNYALSFKYCIRFFKKKQLFDLDLNKLILKSSWRTFFGILFGYGVIQITSLIVQSNETVEVAASFLFTIRLIQFQVDFSRAPFYSKIPKITILYARKKTATLLKIANNGMLLSYTCFTVLCIIILHFGNLFLDLIESETRLLSNNLYIYICISFLIERVGSMNSQLYSITNHIVWHYVNLITGLLFVIIFIITYKILDLGLISFPISLIISYITFHTWYSIFLVLREFGIKYLKLSLAYPILCILYIYIINLFIK